MGKVTSHPKTKMQPFTISNQSFTTIQSLREFAALHNIIPVGNKSIKETWIKAITIYLAAQDSVIAVVVVADPIASDIATKTEAVAVKVGTVAVEILTSETAVLVYRVILKSIAFVLVMCWLVAVSAGKWCWAHRSNTAVYHWMNAAIESEATQWAIVYLVLGEWVLNEWIDTARSIVTSTVQSCRVWASGIMGEVRSVVG